MGAPRRRGGDRAKPPEIRGFSPACGARGAGRRGRASPARRPGPVGKVCRYGRVLAAARRGGRQPRERADMERRQHHCAGGGIAAGRGVGERAGGAKSVSARGGGRTKLVSARGRARKISQRAGQDGAGGLPPARRPGPMEKVCRYGRVLAAAGRGVDSRGGGRAKSVSARGAGGGHGAAAASLRRRGNRRGTGRRRAGRGRKISRRAKRSGRTAGKSRAQDGGQGVVGRRRARL